MSLDQLKLASSSARDYYKTRQNRTKKKQLIKLFAALKNIEGFTKGYFICYRIHYYVVSAIRSHHDNFPGSSVANYDSNKIVKVVTLALFITVVL